MMLPLPIIILDSRLPSPFFAYFLLQKTFSKTFVHFLKRVFNFVVNKKIKRCLTAFGGQCALKFLFGNLVEVKLIESDSKMRMHPIIILLSVAFFGYLWGATGMLLSVPLMTITKIGVLSNRVPQSYRNPILIILEGDMEVNQK